MRPQLLAPANEALGNECLTGVITEYPWVDGITLMTIFAMFFVELMTIRYAHFGDGHAHESGPAGYQDQVDPSVGGKELDSKVTEPRTSQHVPGEDHHGHIREHRGNEELGDDWEARGIIPESYSTQLTAIFILEFGVIFHSIFIGLTLAVAGEEFETLYVVLVFHQTFEGLGLGSRLATVPWPKSKRWTPYMLGLAYGLTTPIAIAIGLGVRQSYPPEGATTLIVNGVFDSISAGILIYTGLVELMAHEFMFSSYMRRAPIKIVLSAFAMMSLGAGKLPPCSVPTDPRADSCRLDGFARQMGIDDVTTVHSKGGNLAKNMPFVALYHTAALTLRFAEGDLFLHGTRRCSDT